MADKDVKVSGFRVNVCGFTWIGIGEDEQQNDKKNLPQVFKMRVGKGARQQTEHLSII